jgi:glutathione S-transferase
MKLYRFPHSPYAHKIHLLLDLLGRRYTLVDVAYLDRQELVAATGGYVHVPVLVDDDGKAIFDSRRIAEALIAGPGGAALVPAGWDGPIWAYADFIDGPVEDILFRLASPAVRAGFRRADERAMYTVVKERKFGTGCVDDWARGRADLLARGRNVLAPTARTLATRPFIFGDQPTLADAALYGLFAMMSVDEGLAPALFGEAFPAWLARLQERRTR